MQPALARAAAHNHADMVELLLGKGANIEAQSNTVSHLQATLEKI